MAEFIKTHKGGKAMLYEGYNIIRFIKGKEVKFSEEIYWEEQILALFERLTI